MLSEDPSFLIRSTIDNFQISGDLQTLDRIKENLSLLQNKRQQRLDESRDILKNLSRQFELNKASSDATATSPSRRQRREVLSNLDKQKFSVAKSLTELETTNNTAQSALAELQSELEKLELEDVMDAAQPVITDSALLKLRLYRSLGVTFEGDDPEHLKILVRSADKESVHTLQHDNNYSDYFVANYIWDSL